MVDMIHMITSSVRKRYEHRTVRLVLFSVLLFGPFFRLEEEFFYGLVKNIYELQLYLHISAQKI